MLSNLYKISQKAEAYIRQFFQKPLLPKDEFARIMTDPQSFQCAVLTQRLNQSIPGLYAFEINLPEKDPNIYRPMPLMEHTFESIRQAFRLIEGFGIGEYRSDAAKNNAMRWINTALLFHDLGETAVIKGMRLPIWYNLAVEWSKNKERNALILKETYPFFGMNTPEARNYLGHLIHAEISALLANDFLSRLEWDRHEIQIIQFLIRNQSILIELATYGRTKDGRTLHGDFYEDIDSLEKRTGIPKDDLLKMLQVLQLADANAVRPGMARIPQVTLMRVWMAYDYMMFVLLVRSLPARYQAFMNYRNVFSSIRREKPFGTPFEELFRELLCRIEKENGCIDENEKKILEQHMEYYEKFRIIKEDHIHSNAQFSQLLYLIETVSRKKLSKKDKALLLTAYKIAYRSHDGHSRKQLKTVPVGDVRRQFIEHPIRVAKIMVEVFGVTDPVVLATLLLHDVLEDTDTNMDDIRAALGKYDTRERICLALEILTHPEAEGIKTQPKYLQEIDYLRYVAGTLTAGGKILSDPELFEWLRIYVALAKASDKIQNRRTLMGRKPKGRIEEICRNGNTLLMFMEASGLNPQQKLKLLDEFNRSMLEIFNLFDLRDPENKNKFFDLLTAFLKRTIPENSGRCFLDDRSRQRLQAFAGDTMNLFAQALQDPAKDIRVKLIQFEKQSLPEFLSEMQMGETDRALILDEFNLLLFSISEVSWLKGKQNLIRFQGIIRRYRELISSGGWEPKLSGIIHDLAHYAQADKNTSPPVFQSAGKLDAGARSWKPAFIDSVHEMYWRHNKKKREFVASILPRVAMLSLKHIYWLEDDEVQCIDRESLEDPMDRILVSRQPDGRVQLSTRP